MDPSVATALLSLSSSLRIVLGLEQGNRRMFVGLEVMLEKEQRANFGYVRWGTCWNGILRVLK
jgi:hypothetical protein